MSTSTDAILAYGYDLGGEDDGWKVREAGKYGELEIGWYDPEDEEGDGFEDVALKHMVTVAGFTADGLSDDEAYGRRVEAQDALGVTVETHCSDESPMYVLSAKTLTARRGRALDASAFLEAADPASLREWDAKLRRACELLGMTPKQEKPKWLLCSYWG